MSITELSQNNFVDHRYVLIDDLRRRGQYYTLEELRRQTNFDLLATHHKLCARARAWVTDNLPALRFPSCSDMVALQNITNRELQRLTEDLIERFGIAE